MGVLEYEMEDEDEVEAASLEQADEEDGENGNVETEILEAMIMRTTMNWERPGKQIVANLDTALVPSDSALRFFRLCK